jgi:hypothetical protein
LEYSITAIMAFYLLIVFEIDIFPYGFDITKEVLSSNLRPYIDVRLG